MAALRITPATATVYVRKTVQFEANGPGVWSVQEPGDGSIDQSGLYTAPDAAGTFSVQYKSPPLVLRAAVEVIERVVTVEKTVRVAQTPRGTQWAETLMTLVKALDTGRYYDKDLDALGAAVVELNHAVERRLRHRHRGRFRT